LFSYYAYGLGIHSEIAIPEFIAGATPQDVTITINKNAAISDYLPTEVIEQPWALRLTREKAIVYVRETGVFLIDNGHKIVFIPVPEAIEQSARFYIVGTVMAILLYQRQFLVLHGSVINFDGEAVIFLGNSGDGKSSTAAALHAAGYNLVNDDVAPITLEDSQVILQPGFPQIKMSQATANALGYDFASLPLIHPSEEKRGYRPQHNFLRSPLTVKRIYILEYGVDFASTPLAASIAVMELSRHSRPTTLYHQGDALHFFQCANLVKEQTIYRLTRPKNLELLPQIANFVATDLAASRELATN
jgi:hypothetical protein